MTQFASILSCNDLALAILKRGDALCAVKVLKQTIQVLQEELRSSSAVASAAASKTGYEAAVGFGVRPAPMVLRSVPISKALTKAAEAQAANGSVELLPLFSRGFQARTFASASSGAVSEDMYRVCSTVLIYNMALAFDAAALQVADPITKTNLQAKATSLYSSSLQSIFANGEASSGMAPLHCIALAAVNNLGRLHSIQLRHFEARQCLETAISWIQSPDVVAHLTEEEYAMLGENVAPFMQVKHCLLSGAPMA